MKPMLSYLVCATPRSGSTLLCHAARPDRHRRPPGGVLRGAAPLGAARAGRTSTSTPSATPTSSSASPSARCPTGAPKPNPLWSPDDLRPVPRSGRSSEGTTPNGVFGAKLMWGYLGDFAELLRGIEGMAGAAAARAARRAFPGPALHPDHARGQGSPGGLAVEGRADPGLAGARRRGRRARSSRCSRSARSTTSCGC